MDSEKVKDMLTLINELESENERLKRSNKNIRIVNNKVAKDNIKFKDRIADLETKNEVLCVELSRYTENCIEMKNGTLKQFAERLKGKLFDLGNIVNESDIDETLKEFINIENGTLIELPKKCYQVIWALGWEIIEYDVVSITYDYDKATITKVIAVRPNSQQVFDNKDLGHFDGIGTHVFFTIAEAEKKLEELKGIR